jgi:hypothetical protein
MSQPIDQKTLAIFRANANATSHRFRQIGAQIGSAEAMTITDQAYTILALLDEVERLSALSAPPKKQPPRFSGTVTVDGYSENAQYFLGAFHSDKPIMFTMPPYFAGQVRVTAMNGNTPSNLAQGYRITFSWESVE